MTLLTVSVIQWRISPIHSALKSFSPGGYCKNNVQIKLCHSTSPLCFLWTFTLLSCSNKFYFPRFGHTLSLTQYSLFVAEHRSSTSVHHLTPFCAVYFTSHHVSCFFSNSAILVYLQVCWGLPHLCFPCGFHSMALLAMYLSGVLSMC